MGWSTRYGSFNLGTDAQGFGFGGTGKKSNSRKFEDYGRAYGKGDVIGWVVCARACVCVCTPLSYLPPARPRQLPAGLAQPPHRVFPQRRGPGRGIQPAHHVQVRAVPDAVHEERGAAGQLWRHAVPLPAASQLRRGARVRDGSGGVRVGARVHGGDGGRGEDGGGWVTRAVAPRARAHTHTPTHTRVRTRTRTHTRTHTRAAQAAHRWRSCCRLCVTWRSRRFR